MSLAEWFRRDSLPLGESIEGAWSPCIRKRDTGIIRFYAAEGWLLGAGHPLKEARVGEVDAVERAMAAL